MYGNHDCVRLYIWNATGNILRKHSHERRMIGNHEGSAGAMVLHNIRSNEIDADNKKCMLMISVTGHSSCFSRLYNFHSDSLDVGIQLEMLLFAR